MGGSALVHMYVRFGKLGDAHLASDQVLVKDVVLMTALIMGYTQHGEDSEALEVFRDMVLLGFEVAIATLTLLLTMYSKCGLIDDYLKVFNEFENVKMVTSTAVIMGLVKFCQMTRSSTNLNAFTLSSVLSDCSALAILELGLVFDDLNEYDIVLLNSMIYGYAQSGCGKEAVRLFDQMQDLVIKPNDMTLLSVLSACSNAGLLEEGNLVNLSKLKVVIKDMRSYLAWKDLSTETGRNEACKDISTELLRAQITEDKESHIDLENRFSQYKAENDARFKSLKDMVASPRSFGCATVPTVIVERS
ncbi:hypothetical protein GIB67_028613 [Kingdonia uniflora]|uniref:Pentatricopeptide repeat-containing protein n=1 Tax=Kingdonia uniflora TaxID=39325 RepID=A0A7J7KZJ6_9MAGN|nr:hypothetical protein GIB67_028613 [Kingdonia uniflora]